MYLPLAELKADLNKARISQKSLNREMGRIESLLDGQHAVVAYLTGKVEAIEKGMETEATEARIRAEIGAEKDDMVGENNKSSVVGERPPQSAQRPVGPEAGAGEGLGSIDRFVRRGKEDQKETGKAPSGSDVQGKVELQGPDAEAGQDGGREDLET